MSDSYKTKEAFLKGSFEHDVSVFDSFGRGRASCATPGNWSVAEGFGTSALGTASHSDGISSVATAGYGFVWNGVSSERYETVIGYQEGLYCINPKDGLRGFYIGSENLQDIIDDRQFDKNDLLTSDNYWSGFNTFTNGRTVTLSSISENPDNRKGTYFRNGATVAASSTPGNFPTVVFSGADYFLVPTFQRVNATVTTTNAANQGYVYSALNQDIINPSRNPTAMIATLKMDAENHPNRIATCKYVDTKFPVATKNRDGYVSGVTKMYDDIYQMFEGSYYRKDPETYTVEDTQKAVAWQHLDGCATQRTISLALCGQHIDSTYNPNLHGTCLADKARSTVDGLPCAWYTVSGKMKLYQTSGYNIDGTMSQYSILTSFGIPLANDTEYGKLKLSDDSLSYDTFTQTYGPATLYSHGTAMTQRAITHSVHVPNSTTDSVRHEPLSSVKGTLFLQGGQKDGLDAYEGCVNADVIYDMWQYHGATTTDVGVLRLYDDPVGNTDLKGAFTQKFITNSYYPIAVTDSGVTGLVKLTTDYKNRTTDLTSAMTKSSIIRFFDEEVAKPASIGSGGICKLYSTVPTNPNDANEDGGVTQKKLTDILGKIGNHEMTSAVFYDIEYTTIYKWRDDGTRGDSVDTSKAHLCNRTVIEYADGAKEEFGQIVCRNASDFPKRFWVPLRSNFSSVELILTNEGPFSSNENPHKYAPATAGVSYVGGCCGSGGYYLAYGI